jgi:hypothetical protein
MMGQVFSSRTLLLLVAVFILGGCQRSARAPIELDADHMDLRLQYAQLYPESPYLDAIDKQEIRKGMNPTQVYLAWGPPVHRFKAEGEQKWIYEFSEKVEGQPKLVAHLFFERKELMHWRIDHSYVFFIAPEASPSSTDEFKDLPDLPRSKRPGG